jgi:hypothetical protein
MALTNCTINSQSFAKTGGSAIGSDNAQLVITPNSGYVVSASNFTNNTGSITGVSSITLSDSSTPGTIGNTVLVNVDLDDTYVMPSADTTLTIDIDGSADLIQYTIAGTYSTTVTNATPISETNTVYSSSGNYGVQTTLFIKSFTATSGYYFKNIPTYILTADNPSRYQISTTTTLDGSNRVIAIAFTVKYTFSNESESGDFISFTAEAEQIFVPTIEITAYSIIQSNISTDGETRTMSVYGYPGAEFSLTVNNEDPAAITTITNQAIPSGGVYAFDITFPAVTDSDQYDFVLTGDLSSDFDTVNGQPSTFNIKQLFDINVAIGLTHSNSSITISANKSKSLLALSEPDDTDGDFDNVFSISSSSGVSISNSSVNLNDFTNTDDTLNGGTNIEIEGFTFSTVSATQINGTLDAYVDAIGDADVTSILNLDSYIGINTAPVANTVSISVDKGGDQTVTLNATDVDGDTLTYYIVSLPSYGTLYSDAGLTTTISAGDSITGNQVYYEHDDSTNFVDSFTYKANDGSVDSNTATVNAAVGVSPGASITTNGNTGIYLVPIILGTSSGTFKAHLNAQSIPDRFQILFDTDDASNTLADMEVVADSLFVGDGVNATTPANGTTSGVDLFTYNGSSFDTTSSGTESIVIADADVVTDSGARTSGSPNGPSRNSSGATQIGVQDLVYTSTSDTTGTTGLDYHDGNICLTYTKPATSTAYIAYLKVYGTTSTAWDLYKTEFV